MGSGSRSVFLPVTTGTSSGGSASKSTGGKSKTGKSSSGSSGASKSGSSSTKPTTLFSYQVTVADAVIAQLMREAKTLNVKQYPASATFLLRNIVECLLKHILETQGANPSGKTLDLEGAIAVCLNTTVSLPATQKKILTEFRKSYLSYLNLGAHGNVVPNPDAAFARVIASINSSRSISRCYFLR
jgi:hypothetical protein